MTTWYSPQVPSYIDIDALSYCVYQAFEEHAPRKSGYMASEIDYQVTGSSVYFWDDCPYAHYQDTGCGGKGAAYEGWWSTDLPKTWDYWLSIFEEQSRKGGS